MPRKKLSEYRAKRIVCAELGLAYQGWEIDADADIAEQLSPLPKGQFVVKVDQAVKGRFKQGLVLLGVPRAQVPAAIGRLRRQGYRWLLVEPMVVHDAAAERYISLGSTRNGLVLTYNSQGGVEVESHGKSMHSTAITGATKWAGIAARTGFSVSQLKALVAFFRAQHMVFLEINPYIIQSGEVRVLDLAVEVDDAGAYFADAWTSSDFRSAARAITPEEQSVTALAEKSPASFKLDVINPNGSIFLLLSGGGASIVAADEVHNLGYGSQLGNYGEYSGNPTAEESYLYTSAVLSLLLASAAPQKVLLIGGAVANFTDIANTFSGVIQAIDAKAAELKGQRVKVFVRRGGPRQEIGLAKIEASLKKHELLGAVYDPSRPLTAVVAEAVQGAAA